MRQQHVSAGEQGTSGGGRGLVRRGSHLRIIVRLCKVQSRIYAGTSGGSYIILIIGRWRCSMAVYGQVSMAA